MSATLTGSDARSDARRSPDSIRRQRSHNLSGLIYTAPTWLLLLGVIAVPLGWGVVLSFYNFSMTSAAPSAFVGIDNYTLVFSNPQFWKSLRITAIIAVGSLVVQLPTGYLLAAMLHRELAGTRLFRTALLIPMLITPVAVGLMWRFMFNSDLGIINYLLELGTGQRVDWLGNPVWALFTIVFVYSWAVTPFTMLLLLAGLQSLPTDPLEAAVMDGANSWQTFRFIVAPMLKPVLLVILIVCIIESVKLFDIVYIVTQGGPGTATLNLSTLGYQTGFTFLATSRAAAISVIVALALSPVYWIWSRMSKP